MHWRTTLSAALLGLALSACGGESHEAVMDEQFDLMGEIFDILDGVEDEASAKEAAKKIEALGEKLTDLAKRAEKLPEPTPEQEKALEARARERQAEFEKRSRAFATKMMQYPDLAQAFSQAMQAMGD